MIKRIVFLLKYTLFWVLLFAFARVLFESYNITKTVQLPINEILLSYVHGLRLDMSLTGYFIFLIGILIALTTFIDVKYIKRPINYVTYLLILITMMITVVDMELYRNWGFRMDTTPLYYLKTPKEALASTSVWLFILLVVFWIAISLTISYLYKRFIAIDLLKIQKGAWYHLPLTILFTGLYFLPVRGTLTVAPINAGTVYFTDNQYANHAAVNVSWNFLDAVLRIKTSKKVVQFIEQDRAQSIFEKLKSPADTTLQLLNTNRPNVVLIVLESFTADGIEAFGGLKGVTPNLNRLASEGVKFSNFYASSVRSDKGLVAILAGYPALDKVSIMNFPNKTRNLPSLAESFNEMGYSTTYYYGGDANFANMKSFMLNQKFQNVEDENALPSSLERNSKWGVHDHLMLDYLTKEIDKESKPFFKVLFTLSSHEPFEVPMNTVIKGDDANSKFLNSLNYTDSVVGIFIEKAKTKPWWKNTLIVLVADHSVHFVTNRDLHQPRRYAIPMIWTGGAINEAREITKIGAQQDIAATLLGQLLADNSKFEFSKNILANNSPEYAFYAWGNGFGLHSNKGSIAFSTDSKSMIFEEGDTTNLKLECEAIFQILSNDFNTKELQTK